MSDLPRPKQTIMAFNENTLPDHIVQKVEERLSTYQGAFSDNTNRARSADYRVFKKWCIQNNLNPVPCLPENIERFLWDSVSKPKINETSGEIITNKEGKVILQQIRSTATIERYLATIKYLHDVAYEVVQDITDPLENVSKLKNPVDTRRVRIALKAIKRKFRSKAQRQAYPIRLDLLDIILTTLDNSLRHTLYKALISVGFDSMMRCSELVRIELDHISYHDDGSGSIYVPFHKSDQEGEGGYRYLSATSVNLIHNWLTDAHIENGLLFRSVDRGGIILNAMHKDRVSKIYKIVAKLCNVNSSAISAHSTRVGAAQELLSNGASMPALMVAGDWKSSAMPVRYAKKINVATGAMAELARNKGRT
jgi:integrase